MRPITSGIFFLSFAMAVASFAAYRPARAQVAVAPGSLTDFSLPTADGRTVSLSSDPSVQLHVVCFLGTECPLARMYGPKLQRMSQQLADRGVQFIGINSNVQDSMEEWQRYGQLHEITFPLAKDYDRRVALQVGATRTPEVLVVDRAGSIRYRGRIDDQYEPGISRKQATTHDLRNAIEALLAGKTVSVPRTEAVGCLIALPRNGAGSTEENDVTFCDQVMRVLQKHCIECHRDGEIGPFALDDYDQVVGWADMSIEVIDQGRMPPWHANPEFGSFHNARVMPESDKQLLRRWVEADMPYGDPTQLPPQKSYVQGWRLPAEPDLVLEISDKPFQVPAEGTVEYQYFVVDPGFTEDRWIRAAQVLPGNNSVVHHCIAFTRPPDGADFRDIGLLSAYVPGQIRGELPEGYAQRVRAGSLIVFQMHYTPTGKPEQDLTRFGLVFADADEVTHEVFALGGIEQEFEIPPGAANHQVNGKIEWFPKDGFLLALTPHMHLRGKKFRFHLHSAGQKTTLLDVPAYDFNWQHNYELTEPLPLARIDELSFTAVFDNSPGNPTNPDPTEYVTWGDQTWQEMAVTFITVARPVTGEDPDLVTGDGTVVKDTRSPRMLEEVAEYQKTWDARHQQWEKKAEAFARGYIERFDRNADGVITSRELPDAVRMFSFWMLDHNNDNRVSHDEIKAEALWRFQNEGF